MNLLESMMEPCIMMDKTSIPDGAGGFTNAWVEGAEFLAFVRKETAPELIVAEKEGVKVSFTVVVKKGVPLDYHDVFRRVSDGEIFRTTSRVLDDAAPESASPPVKIAKAGCERWALV